MHFLAYHAAEATLCGPFVHIDENNIAVPAVSVPIDHPIRSWLRWGIQRKGSRRLAVVLEAPEKKSTEAGGRAAGITGTHERRGFSNGGKSGMASAHAHVNSRAVVPMAVAANKAHPPFPIVGIVRQFPISPVKNHPAEKGGGCCASR
jgi:hypothetical protein